MRASSVVSIVVASALAVVRVLSASDAHAEGVRALRYDTRIDVAVTSVGAVWWMTSELLKASLVPNKCRWCYRGEDGKDLLNPVDASVRTELLWNDRNTANTASSVLAFFVEPAAMMGLSAAAAGHDKNLKGAPVDTLIIAEATILAGDVNQLVKFAFARERPFVHFLPRAPSEVRALTDSPSDDNLSFFSGHTTLAFALAASAGTVATMRDYRLAPLVWATGLTMATTVGYLRIAADKHYFSDVMTAAVVGTVIGAGIPLLFHSPVAGSDAPPSASGQALTGSPIRTAFSMGSAF